MAESIDSAPGTAAIVLLVEDDSSIAALMTELLRDLGCTVHHATSFDSALSLAGAIGPNLIVTDLLIAGGQARPWENVLRLRDTAPEASVLVVTGLSGADRDGHAHGITVLAKPFDLEEFEVAVSELFSRPGVACRE